ncbi:hypothetical protein CROQUDRAFT_690934 [Cronartium quercuum f. sp. fusiforme G11]|uniref:Uncharacterized protein n=1 Tax=Cronartium quercuum f. sp. fusiforme G11 TaxID=708437 RepID=A0A9P6NN62_9BASI|nr:hypothetical protein CROQUDRAFT_690934 [Cronartium quercuum f. sp. fusiforme G11]
MGSVQRTLSHIEYEHVQITLQIGGLMVPNWASIQRIRADLCKCLGLKVANTTSPLGNPCFSLDIQEILKQELANPLVWPHLICVPESSDTGVVNWLSKSWKW